MVFIIIRLRSIVLYFAIWFLRLQTQVNVFFIIHCYITFLELIRNNSRDTSASEEISNNTDIDSLKEGADKNMDELDIKENYVSGSPFNSRMKWKMFSFYFHLFNSEKPLRKKCHIKVIYKVWIQEEFEDTKLKGITRIYKSKKDRQHNDQKKRTKGQITIYKTYT